MISRLSGVSTASFTGAVAGEGGKQSQQVNRGYGMLRKKGQRILITERKISLLRVDACHSVQALSSQKEKTTSMLSALTGATSTANRPISPRKG
jgi:hypothetical protein